MLLHEVVRAHPCALTSSSHVPTVGHPLGLFGATRPPRAQLHGQPSFLTVIPDNIPRELVENPAWYPAIIKPRAGKPGKWDKIPGDPATGGPATWSDPTTRSPFDQAYMAYQSDPRFGGLIY